ncbi:MAG: hypothetical protein HY560_04315 [Gemmatimonadetes bacterium]|nr:hypothetical protein [Gemmatimonadota bacterium]
MLGDMIIEPSDFRSRVRLLLAQQGAGVTEEELSQMAARYPRCVGKEQWDVREYARRTGLGAREYRVVRGSSVQDVYCSTERGSAAAVRTALNELESTEKAPGGLAS